MNGANAPGQGDGSEPARPEYWTRNRAHYSMPPYSSPSTESAPFYDGNPYQYGAESAYAPPGPQLMVPGAAGHVVPPQAVPLPADGGAQQPHAAQAAAMYGVPLPPVPQRAQMQYMAPPAQPVQQMPMLQVQVPGPAPAMYDAAGNPIPTSGIPHSHTGLPPHPAAGRPQQLAPPPPSAHLPVAGSGQARTLANMHNHSGSMPQLAPVPAGGAHGAYAHRGSKPHLAAPKTHASVRSVPHVRYSGGGSRHARTSSVPRARQGSPQKVYMAHNAPYVAHLRPVSSWSELQPQMKEPKYRRANAENGYTSPLVGLTASLPATYNLCDPSFQYSQATNPRRVLTEPHEPTLNSGFDNAESDYILYVNDVLGAEENRKYLALNILGKGTFGQVVKCQNMVTKEIVAVKVIKNKPAFLNQSLMEVSILEHLGQSTSELLGLKDRFMHKQHLCLVFELLGSNLYEVIKKNNFKGLDINIVRVFVQQLLHSLAILKSAQLIHCDLKPENILLKSNDGTAVKIIDFGSACHERQTVYTYIQSRFYRSPEVLLGLPYTSAIDMWSLGCIIAELFLGLPIFPGASEYDQLARITDSLGYPPVWMMDMGKNTTNFMVKSNGAWRMRTIDEQNQAFNASEREGKKYFASPDLRKTIMSYPCSRSLSKAEFDEEMRQRELLTDFVLGLLIFNPFERWTPQQAAMHPFVAQGQAPLPAAKTSAVRRGPVRVRANTVGQVQSSVPVPIQQAAARVDPGDMHRENTSYVPLREHFDNV